jgi:hypothetical protein
MNQYILVDIYEICYKVRVRKWGKKFKLVNKEYLDTYEITLFDLDSFGINEYLMNISPQLEHQNVVTNLVNWRDLDYIYEAQIEKINPGYWFIRPWLPNVKVFQNLYGKTFKNRYLLPDRYCYSTGLDRRNMKVIQ